MMEKTLIYRPTQPIKKEENKTLKSGVHLEIRSRCAQVDSFQKPRPFKTNGYTRCFGGVGVRGGWSMLQPLSFGKPMYPSRAGY